MRPFAADPKRITNRTLLKPGTCRICRSAVSTALRRSGFIRPVFLRAGMEVFLRKDTHCIPFNLSHCLLSSGFPALGSFPCCAGEQFPKKNQLPGQFQHFATRLRFLWEHRSANLIFKLDRDRKPVSESQLQMGRETGSRFSYENRSAIFVLQWDRDFETALAITIAIINKSGKTCNRFSSRNRVPVFIGKTISDYCCAR